MCIASDEAIATLRLLKVTAMESGAEALAGATTDTTVSSTCDCVPVVILYCISQPVANQLLEDLEGRP